MIGKKKAPKKDNKKLDNSGANDVLKEMNNKPDDMCPFCQNYEKR